MPPGRASQKAMEILDRGHEATRNVRLGIRGDRRSQNHDQKSPTADAPYDERGPQGGLGHLTHQGFQDRGSGGFLHETREGVGVRELHVAHGGKGGALFVHQEASAGIDGVAKA